MGYGNDLAQEAMIDAMVAEDLKAQEERDKHFSWLRKQIQEANTVEQFRDILLTMLEDIENKT